MVLTKKKRMQKCTRNKKHKAAYSFFDLLLTPSLRWG